MKGGKHFGYGLLLIAGSALVFSFFVLNGLSEHIDYLTEMKKVADTCPCDEAL